MFKPSKATLVWSLPFEGAWATSVAFLGSSQKLVAGNRNGQLLMWNLPTEATKDVPVPTHQFDAHTNGITHLQATSDGKTLISTSLDHTIKIWNPDAPSTGEVEIIVDSETREKQAKRKRDKSILEAPGVKVKVLKPTQVLSQHQDWIQALGISGDGKRFITGDDQSQIIVWDTATRKPINQWKGTQWIVAADLSPDGQTVLVSEYRSKGGDFNRYPPSLKLWDVANGKVKKDLFPDTKDRRKTIGFFARGLITGQYSPDGKLVAVGQGGETGTGKVHVIDVSTGKVLHSLNGHRYGVTDLTFTADGKYLLSCGRDTMVRVWQVDTGKEVVSIGESRGGQFKDWLYAIALSPEEHWLAAADIAGQIQIWKF